MSKQTDPKSAFAPAAGYATVCPVCRNQIENQATRLDAQGRRWCKKCEDWHDSIDWDAVYHGDDNPSHNNRAELRPSGKDSDV